jgi:hypothetical protein
MESRVDIFELISQTAASFVDAPGICSEIGGAPISARSDTKRIPRVKIVRSLKVLGGKGADAETGADRQTARQRKEGTRVDSRDDVDRLQMSIHMHACVCRRTSKDQTWHVKGGTSWKRSAQQGTPRAA